MIELQECWDSSYDSINNFRKSKLQSSSEEK